MIRTKKISNAECLRTILKINEQWSKKNNKKLLTDNVVNSIQSILDSTDDDDLINLRFNRMLKSNKEL